MKVMRPVMPEKASIRPALAFSTPAIEPEIALMRPIALRPATMVEAATIRTTTFENPSPIPLKKRLTSFIDCLGFFLRMSSATKDKAKEKSVISTSPTFADLKKSQKKMMRTSGSTGKTAYHKGASVVRAATSAVSSSSMRPTSRLSIYFCHR